MNLLIELLLKVLVLIVTELVKVYLEEKRKK